MQPRLGFIADVFELMDALGALDDEASIRAAILSVVGRCGLDHFAVCRLPQPRYRIAKYMLLKKWPDEWLRHYDARGYYRADPVVSRCFSDLRPFTWSDIDTGEPENELPRRIMGEAADHGLAAGLSIPISDINGFQAVVSMAGARVAMEASDRRALHLLGLAAFEVAERLAGRPEHRAKGGLSPREREVLQLSATGLTSGAVADRLGISNGTVVTHLKGAREKLGALNTTHAVVRALRSRQIRL